MNFEKSCLLQPCLNFLMYNLHPSTVFLIVMYIYIFLTNVDLQVDLGKESLLKQFQIVKQETNTSHVMQYGELVCCFNIIAFLVI